jgi:hypothetical protein
MVQMKMFFFSASFFLSSCSYFLQDDNYGGNLAVIFMIFMLVLHGRLPVASYVERKRMSARASTFSPEAFFSPDGIGWPIFPDGRPELPRMGLSNRAPVLACHIGRTYLSTAEN